MTFKIVRQDSGRLKAIKGELEVSDNEYIFKEHQWDL